MTYNHHTSCHCSSTNWRVVFTGGESTILSRKRGDLALGNWNAILGDGERGEKVVRRREGGEKRGREMGEEEK